MNTQEDNKDIQMLKKELWTRRMTAENNNIEKIQVVRRFKFIGRNTEK